VKAVRPFISNSVVREEIHASASIFR
jgi:hypothetical protein